MASTDFAKLFEDGRVIRSGEWTVTLRAQAICDLALPTGRLVACDPFTTPDADAFVRDVPGGAFPVVLSVARFDDGDERVAAAMIRFAEAPAVRWEMALVPEDDPAELAEGEVFGYGVDSGAGCFMDEAAAEALMDRMERDERYFESMAAEMDKTYVDTWSWASIAPDEGIAANVVAFSVTADEGVYASYFGLDEGGRVVSLVTDFSLFELEEIA